METLFFYDSILRCIYFVHLFSFFKLSFRSPGRTLNVSSIEIYLEKKENKDVTEKENVRD